MTYLQLLAGGYRLLVPAETVRRVMDVADAHGDVLDLSSRLGASAPRMVVCLDGTALGVDAVVQLIDLPDDALLPVPWLPADAAALVDAVSEAGWRLRAGL